MAKADDEQGRGVGQDAAYGVVELKPFAGDPFDGKTKRRWAAVRFASLDKRSFFPLKQFDTEQEAADWLVHHLSGRAA